MEKVLETEAMVNNDTAFQKIILPVYDSSNSFMPFMHALKLAYCSKGVLEIVDVRSDPEISEQISVRSLLEKWGILPEGSHRSDVLDIGLRIKKIFKKGNKQREIIKRLYRHNHDLLVIGGGSGLGLLSMFRADLATRIVLAFNNPTLYIPNNVHSFIKQDDGEVTLESIGIAADCVGGFYADMRILQKLKAVFSSIQPQLTGIYFSSTLTNENSAPALCAVQEMVIAENLSEGVLKVIPKKHLDLLILAIRKESHSYKKQVLKTLSLLKTIPCPVLLVSSE